VWVGNISMRRACTSASDAPPNVVDLEKYYASYSSSGGDDFILLFEKHNFSSWGETAAGCSLN
jgi:hypothetical protein